MDGDSDENDHAENEEFISPDEFESTDSLPEQIRCASHTSNRLATTDMLNCIKSCKILQSSYNQVIQRCNVLWKFLSSPKNSEKLKNILGQSLQKPVVTRWNSLYQSIFQIFGLKDKILSSGEELGIDNLLDKDNFRFIEEYLHCNQSIADVINKLQGDKLASYGYLLPTLVTIRNKLNRCKQLRFQYCHKLVPGLLKALDNRFGNIYNVIDEEKKRSVAAGCHPKFELNWLASPSSRAQANAMEAIKEALKSSSDQPVNDDTFSEEADDFFDFTSYSESVPEENSINFQTLGSSDSETMYQKFLAHKSNDIKILELYPIVKQVFLKFNTPVPSSAPVERLFGYATMFNLPKFNKLTDQNFELRVVMKCNASAAKKGRN